MLKRLAFMSVAIVGAFIGVMVVATEPCACLTATESTIHFARQVDHTIDEWKAAHEGRCPGYSELHRALHESKRPVYGRLAPYADRKTFEILEEPILDASGEPSTPDAIISRHRIYYGVNEDGSACALRAAVPKRWLGIVRHGVQLVPVTPLE